MTDRRVWDKLATEIDTAILEGRMSEEATYNEAQKLPYLQACIKEAMRMHPSLGTQHKRLVPDEGMTVDGKYLPPNVNHTHPTILLNLMSLTILQDYRRYFCLGYAQANICLWRRCRRIPTRTMD